MMATAPAAFTALASAAAFVRQFAFIGHASEGECFADVLPDFLLHVMHFLLRFDEAFGRGIGEQRVAQFFKTGNLRFRQRNAGMLFLMEGAALLIDRLILLLGLGVAHERVNALANALELGLLNDGFAKLERLLMNEIVRLCLCLHKYIGAAQGADPKTVPYLLQRAS